MQRFPAMRAGTLIADFFLGNAGKNDFRVLLAQTQFFTRSCQLPMFLLGNQAILEDFFGQCFIFLATQAQLL